MAYIWADIGFWLWSSKLLSFSSINPCCLLVHPLVDTTWPSRLTHTPDAAAAAWGTVLQAAWLASTAEMNYCCTSTPDWFILRRPCSFNFCVYISLTSCFSVWVELWSDPECDWPKVIAWAVPGAVLHRVQLMILVLQNLSQRPDARDGPAVSQKTLHLK